MFRRRHDPHPSVIFLSITHRLVGLTGIVNVVSVGDGTDVTRQRTGDLKIAARIEEARKASPLTDDEIGGQINRSGRWVYEVAKGYQGVPAQYLLPLATALGVTVGFLLSEPEPDHSEEFTIRPHQGFLTQRDRDELLSLAEMKARYNASAVPPQEPDDERGGGGGRRAG